MSEGRLTTPRRKWADTMDLVRDLLDNQLIDRNGRNIGRVDGIVLQIRRDRPPRVLAMELGSVTLARRLHRSFGRWWIRFAKRWLPVSVRPVRIGLETLEDVGVDVKLDVDGGSDRRLLRGEKWLRRHVIRRLPGGHS